MAGLTIEAFADRLNQLMPELLRGFLRRETDEIVRCNVTLPQFIILNFLADRGQVKMSEVAHFLQVSTAAATGNIDRLVKAGYVLRVFEPQDRRIIKVGLTPRGARTVQRINQQKKRLIVDVFGQISEQERDTYLRILMRVREIMQRETKAKVP